MREAREVCITAYFLTYPRPLSRLLPRPRSRQGDPCSQTLPPLGRCSTTGPIPNPIPYPSLPHQEEVLQLIQGLFHTFDSDENAELDGEEIKRVVTHTPVIARIIIPTFIAPCSCYLFGPFNPYYILKSLLHP